MFNKTPFAEKQKSSVGNAEKPALPTGQLLYSKIGTFDLLFVFT
jgi:hypothetical protein